jgi:hypothetical protein
MGHAMFIPRPTIRDLRRAVCLLPLLLAELLAPPSCRGLSGAEDAPRSSPPGAPQASLRFKYTGPGACSAFSCHGGITARQASRVLQNEYSTWVGQDTHARAYTVLTNSVSTRMGRILGIGDPQKASKCLVCHALDVPEQNRAQTFDLTDGVSCECCHGPAAAWLGEHTTLAWRQLTPQDKAEKGMYDTKDLIPRSEGCLTCHLGTEDKFVDHEMLAAGHPDLRFELEYYSVYMPRHWKEPLDKDPWIEVRGWSTGQAVQLREDLRRLARRAHGKVWPEYTELDCFACHHSLTDAKDSWRQERGYPGRTPGVPPWNTSRYAVFRQVASEADPAASRELETDVDRLFTEMSKLSNNREEIASQALSAAELADRLAQEVNSTSLDPASTRRWLQNISADSSYIAGQGERAAEQAAMGLSSLFSSYSRNTSVGNEQQIRDALNALLDLLRNPSYYNQYTFEEKMRALNTLLK